MRAFLSAVRSLYLERWSEAENISKRNRIFFFLFSFSFGRRSPFTPLQSGIFVFRMYQRRAQDAE